MLRSRFTRHVDGGCLLTDRAFALSFDAALAVLLFVAALAFIQIAPYPAPDYGVSLAHTQQLADDAIAALENTGFIAEQFDTLGFSQGAADAIYAKFRELAPDLDANIGIKEYDYNLEACRQARGFAECFPESEAESIIAGSPVPEDRSRVRGGRAMVRKQGPSECVKELQFAGRGSTGARGSGAKPGKIFFAESPIEKLLLQGNGDENVNFTFDVNVVPGDEVECGEDITVTLSAGAIVEGRMPVDVIPVIDRSGSMDECAIADGNVTQQLSGSIGGGERECLVWLFFCWVWEYDGWQRIADVNVVDGEAFDVLMAWTADCDFEDGECPDMYVEAPDGTRYGFYGGEPDDGCYVKAQRNNTAIYMLISGAESQNGTWGVYAWNEDPEIYYDLTIKEVEGKIKKIDAVKNATTEFVLYPDWNSEAHGDQLGLVSYAKNAKLDQQLLLATDANKQVVVGKVEGLEPGGGTATGEGIYKATGELTSERADPAAMSFQIVLSDGHTNQGREPVGAAADAYSKGITVYTIGFGPDADSTELAQIAEAGGGKYYAAFDVNRLGEVYELIAQDIGNAAEGGVGVQDVTVYIPITDGMEIVDPDGGTVEGGWLVFDVGDLNGASPWIATYVVRFPCIDPNCDINTVTIPGEGAYVEYDGQQITWDVNVTLFFKYRDLNVMVLSGEIHGENDVWLDVYAANTGYLDTPSTSVNFYVGDPAVDGEFITSSGVSAFCPMNEPGCTDYNVTMRVHLSREGELYAIINESGEIAECPGNNKDWIFCSGAPKTKFYSLQYAVWRAS